ncbi:hypothetical protein cypCar_00029733, partial [Cyprinus carpio]
GRRTPGEATDIHVNVIKMAFIKEESEDVEIEEAFRVKQEDTEELTECDNFILLGDPVYPLLEWLIKGYPSSPTLTPEQASTPQHGRYANLPPVEEALAADLCPESLKVNVKSLIVHPNKACRMMANIAGKAYTAAGQAASALHTMAVLVFQAKMLKQLDEHGPDPEIFRGFQRH